MKTLCKQAEQYTKRMETEKALALRVPEEWDFREVRDEELAQAVEYEFMRENNTRRGAAVSWLESKVKRVSVREILLNGEDVPLSGTADKLHCGVAYFFPLFPIPWMAMEPESRMVDFAFGDTLPAVHVFTVPGASPVWMKYFESRGGMLLDVQWNRKTEDIIRDFGKWIRAEAKKRKRSSGKASYAPYHKLKQLSALRLHKAGLSYEKAQVFIKENASGNNPNDILPIYASQGSWHDAVNSAKQEADNLIFESPFEPVPRY